METNELESKILPDESIFFSKKEINVDDIPKGKWHDHHTKRVKGNRQYIWDHYKTHPCVVCGENDPIVLEFNHINLSTKKADVSSLIKRTRKQLVEEIEKCEVLCSNCHRRHTAKQQNWYSNVVK